MVRENVMRKFLLPAALFFASFMVLAQFDGRVSAAEEEQLTLGDMTGVWVQIVDNQLVARKEIYERAGQVYMRYLWLRPGYVGGEYGKLDVDEDGDIFCEEDYGAKQTVHYLRPETYFRMECVQSGPPEMLYLMLREE